MTAHSSLVKVPPSSAPATWMYLKSSGLLNIMRFLVNSTRQSITLVFNQVSLDMHGAQYTCHVTSPYGTQERNITVITEGETVTTLGLVLWKVLILVA